MEHPPKTVVSDEKFCERSKQVPLVKCKLNETDSSTAAISHKEVTKKMVVDKPIGTGPVCQNKYLLENFSQHQQKHSLKNEQCLKRQQEHLLKHKHQTVKRQKVDHVNCKEFITNRQLTVVSHEEFCEKSELTEQVALVKSEPNETNSSIATFTHKEIIKKTVDDQKENVLLESDITISDEGFSEKYKLVALIKSELSPESPYVNLEDNKFTIKDHILQGLDIPVSELKIKKKLEPQKHYILPESNPDDRNVTASHMEYCEKSELNKLVASIKSEPSSSETPYVNLEDDKFTVEETVVKTEESNAELNNPSPAIVGCYIGVVDSLACTVSIGEPSETPLRQKRVRRWDPTSDKKAKAPPYPISTQRQEHPVTSPKISIQSKSVGSVASSAVAPSAVAPSPVAPSTVAPSLVAPFPVHFIEIGESSENSTPKLLQKPRMPRRPLKDLQLDQIVNYGSDNDSDDSEEELPFLHCPRSERMFWDDLYDEKESPPAAEEPAIAAEEPAMAAEEPAMAAKEPVIAAESSLAAAQSEESIGCIMYGPTDMFNFTWKPLPKPPIPWRERRETFTESSGPVTSFSSPYEAFLSIWDKHVIDIIVSETNRYADQCIIKEMESGTLQGSSRLLRFKQTNADEIYTFLALIIATGIVYKADLSEYWSINSDVFDTPNFGKYMSYNRFLQLGQMLHFSNNEIEMSHLSPPEAKIHKIMPIVTHLNTKFQQLYKLNQCIALDESLTQWKGWLSIYHFNKNKAAAKAIKTYEVCDSTTGYLWRFQMHAGREINEDTDVGYITSLVLKLLNDLENIGHSVFMDNYYNSPVLARILKSRGFDCVGTIRSNRQHMPPDVRKITKQDMKPGDVYGATSGDVDILVWRDKNLVRLISTYHGAQCFNRDGKTKPTLVHDYHTRMCGVDKKDQMLSQFPIERKKTRVWYKRFFRRLLNVSVFNAFLLHRESPVPEHPHPHATKQREFRKILVKSILNVHCPMQKILRAPPPAEKIKFGNEFLNHLPAQYPYCEKQKQKLRRSCILCRKRTQWFCPGCNVALCLENCFRKQHAEIIW